MAANLTFVSIQARKVIRYGIYFIVILLVGRVAFGFARTLYNTLVPKPPPPPTVGFGVLPAINYPEVNIEYPELKYTIETPSGELPPFPEQMRVYLMPQKTADLFSFDNMVARAKGLGFTRQPRQKSDNVYIFDHPEVPATFETDIIYETFSISYNLSFDSSPLGERPPDEEKAKTIANKALSSTSSKAEDLSGPVKIEFLKVAGEKLVRALSLSDSQLVQVNFYRKDIGEVGEEGEDKPLYPSVTSDKNQSNVWFIVSGSGEKNKDIIAGEYKYYPVDLDRFETYPTKTAENALKELNEGKAYIANLGLNTGGNITIRRIYLAYYDPDRANQFYQPVIVFEDESTGFQAYVPAVTTDYYGEGQKDSPAQ